MKVPTLARRLLMVPVALCAVLAGGAVGRVQDQCGPFTDVSATLCPYVLEMYYLGITAGTSPTTFSPDATMTRGQAAVFVSKGVNQAIARSSRRAALGQWWTTNGGSSIARTPYGSYPGRCASDGADVWATTYPDGNVARIRASDGKLLEVWTGAPYSFGVLSAMGRVFVTGNDVPGSVYMIDPALPAGNAVVIAEDLGDNPVELAFDGLRLWTIGFRSVSILSPGPTLPWAVTEVTDGIVTPASILFDGSHIWVADDTNGLLRLNSNGQVIQNVTVGYLPHQMTFDGFNLWVPNTGDDTISVVRVDTGTVVATLSGNGLAIPVSTAFDGRRVLVTNGGANTVSIWQAADLAPLGSFDTGLSPTAACSDGLNFWLALQGQEAELGRF